MKNKLATLVGALALSAAASAQTWIWYPGDYEIWLGNRMNNRRTERGAFFPSLLENGQPLCGSGIQQEIGSGGTGRNLHCRRRKIQCEIGRQTAIRYALHLETPRRKTQSEHQSVESVHSPHYLCERKNRKYGQDLESNLRRQGMDRRKRKSQ